MYVGPDLRPRTRAILTSSDRTAGEICTAPAGDRVIVITRSHTAESSRAELFVFDSQGQMVNHFEKFDLVRATYIDLPLIDINLYYLSLLFSLVLILSGGAALYYLVKAKHFATIALILMLTCMCAPCVAVSYMFSWLPP
jgi:hypothetical protein